MFDIPMPIRDCVIIPDKAYNHMCENHPDREAEWTNVDGWLHKMTHASQFAFESTPDEPFTWQENKNEYE